MVPGRLTRLQDDLEQQHDRADDETAENGERERSSAQTCVSGPSSASARPTVKAYVENIYQKLGATTRAEAVKRAERAGLLPLQ